MIIIAFLSSCEDDCGGAYMERMGMEGKKFTSFVIALDYGCHNCKDQFYKYVLEAYPEKCALIFKREPDAATLVNYQGLFSKKYVFIDSLDISFEMGITHKNTELALGKKGNPFIS